MGSNQEQLGAFIRDKRDGFKKRRRKGKERGQEGAKERRTSIERYAPEQKVETTETPVLKARPRWSRLIIGCWSFFFLHLVVDFILVVILLSLSVVSC